MNLKRLIPTAAVTAVCTFGAVPAASAATSDVQQASSANWSGYVVGGGAGGGSDQSFSTVTGSWVQPTANCTGAQSYAAFWVGLGGSGASGSGQAQALEQAGTEADCTSDGTPSYFAWYELVPSGPVRIGLTVNPGDHISSRVAVNGDTVTVQLSDQTTGQSTTRPLTMDNPDTSSAEWIAEAPSSCDQTGTCQPLPLTDFGTVTFAGASATSGAHTGTISDADWSAAAVQLGASDAGAGIGASQFASGTESTAGATPSGLSGDGSSFSVAYSSASAQTSGGANGYDGGGYGPGADGGYGVGAGDGGYGDGAGGDGGYYSY